MKKNHSKSDYAEQLKRPEWKALRNRLLNERGNRCERCMRTDDYMRIHHNYYVSKRPIWDYPDWSFEILCGGCHDGAHDFLEQGAEIWMHPFEEVIDALMPNVHTRAAVHQLAHITARWNFGMSSDEEFLTLLRELRDAQPCKEKISLGEPA